VLWNVNPGPAVQVTLLLLLAKSIRRSPGWIAVTGALVTLEAAPPSLVILEMTSIGAIVFEPLMTRTEITSDEAEERLIVTEWELLTYVGFEYHA